MMHAQAHRKRVIAGTAILFVMAVLTLSAADGGAKKLSEATAVLASHAAALFAAAYRTVPALTVGLVFAICIPVLAGLIRLSKPITRSKDATRLYKPKPGHIDAFDAAVAQGPAISRQPFIEIENGRGMRCAILRDMLRIGREDDNDIRIPSRYVHRYHAAIHREDYDAWHITDLTGVESNGLIVNGKRCCEARLNDGDLIQLGPGKLRFRAGAG